MNRFILLLMVTLIGQGAIAETEDYFSVGGTYMQFDDGENNESDVGALILNFGHRYRDKIIFETRVGTSLTEHDIELPVPDEDGTTDVLFKVDYLAGVYVKFSPFEKANLSPYITGGYTFIRNSLSYQSGRIKEHEDGPSFGVGLDLCGDRYCANVDVTRYINDHNYAVDAASLNFAYRY